MASREAELRALMAQRKAERKNDSTTEKLQEAKKRRLLMRANSIPEKEAKEQENAIIMQSYMKDMKAMKESNERNTPEIDTLTKKHNYDNSNKIEEAISEISAPQTQYKRPEDLTPGQARQRAVQYLLFRSGFF